jgi:hypothetical protein
MSYRVMTIYAGFLFNSDFIAEVLCVNKEIPDNCCKGKCFLDNEVKKSEEEQSVPMNNQGSYKKLLSLHFMEIKREISLSPHFKRYFDSQSTTLFIIHTPLTPPPEA